jgi:signal transduction histidine kinase
MVGFADGGRFGAIAVPIDVPITVDGVSEWEPGDIVYEVIQPLGGGQAILLTYDISELLARRSTSRGVPILALQLAGVAAFLLVAATLLFVARSRVARTLGELALQSEYLRRESEVLTEHNRELEAARRRAEHAYELAEEKNRIRSEFVLMINHELRTPLTGVVTGAELLRSSGAISDEVWLEILDDVLNDGRRLSEMIDQILAVARIENGALFFALHDVEMVDVVDRLELARPRFDIPDRGALNNMVLRTDPTSLVNLIQSLADNAFTHGAKNVGVTTSVDLPFQPMLEVGLRPESPVYVLIHDDGPGIDIGFLPRAFEKFEKQSRSSGTGLGLYIARLMSDALSGSILITTSEHGTTVAVALPAGQSKEVAA